MHTVKVHLLLGLRELLVRLDGRLPWVEEVDVGHTGFLRRNPTAALHVHDALRQAAARLLPGALMRQGAPLRDAAHESRNEEASSSSQKSGEAALPVRERRRQDGIAKSRAAAASRR